jgi:hypothetical protein
LHARSFKRLFPALEMYRLEPASGARNGFLL